jgi:dTDP-4-amino-4,6-dideoxygalactose transaminase
MRMDTIQAAVLLEKFKNYNEDEERRQQIARKYADGIEGMPFQNQPEYSTCALFSILCSNRAHRKEIQKRLGPYGSAIYYPEPLHKQKVFREDLICYSYPNSEELSERILQIPMHPYLREDEVDEIIGIINGVDL